ncbi:MAG: hypothetical protein JXB49_29675 [Bacteroidales bacterium]|nr:hypothetical protein [Bacteroidales bacterium]
MNSDACTHVIKNGLQNEIRYKQIKPFNLYINKSLADDRCVIEISAKVLGDRYPELINKNNIRYCFERMNESGICKLNIDGVITASDLISADITTDLDGIVMPDLLAIKICLKSLNKYQVQKYANCGYTVTKLVKTQNRKIRLSIYDKYKEMQKVTNVEYLDLLDDKYNLLAYFNGKYRIEANVRTVTQLKELLEIDGNSLLVALNSTANPLFALFNSVFDVSDESEPILNEIQSLLSYRKLSELKDALLIKACNNDLSQIDLVLNSTLSPNTNKRKYRAKLSKLINVQPIPNKNLQVMNGIKQKLLELKAD